MEFVRAFMSSGRKEQVRKYKEYGDMRERVRENSEYYELSGTGEKIQRVW
jgi:hypothetical protein